MDGSNPVRITREGDHQVIHLPADLSVPDNAVVRQEGERLIIESAQMSDQKARLLALLATMKPIDEVLGPIDDPSPEPFNL